MHPGVQRAAKYNRIVAACLRGYEQGWMGYDEAISCANKMLIREHRVLRWQLVRHGCEFDKSIPQEAETAWNSDYDAETKLIALVAALEVLKDLFKRWGKVTPI